MKTTEDYELAMASIRDEHPAAYAAVNEFLQARELARRKRSSTFDRVGTTLGWLVLVVACVIIPLLHVLGYLRK